MTTVILFSTPQKPTHASIIPILDAFDIPKYEMCVGSYIQFDTKPKLIVTCIQEIVGDPGSPNDLISNRYNVLHRLMVMSFPKLVARTVVFIAENVIETRIPPAKFDDMCTMMKLAARERFSVTVNVVPVSAVYVETSLMSYPLTFSRDWIPIVNIDLFNSIVASLDMTSRLPPKDQLLTAFTLTPFTKLRAVILGQDPYPTPGHAHGLSFSVQDGVSIPPSLRNIFKAIKKFDPAYEVPESGNLTHWASQGVLLLNCALTVEERKAGSDVKLWEQFTDELISHISAYAPKVIFMLWGNFAKSKEKFIDASKHTILKYSHPSPLAGTTFDCNHFQILTRMYPDIKL